LRRVLPTNPGSICRGRLSLSVNVHALHWGQASNQCEEVHEARCHADPGLIAEELNMRPLAGPHLASVPGWTLHTGVAAIPPHLLCKNSLFNCPGLQAGCLPQKFAWAYRHALQSSILARHHKLPPHPPPPNSVLHIQLPTARLQSHGYPPHDHLKSGSRKASVQ